MSKFSFVVALVSLPVIFCASFIENLANNDTTFPTQQNSLNDSISEVVKSTKLIVKKTCQQEYSSACLKIDLIKIMDRLTLKQPLYILPGLTLVQKPTESSPYKSLPLQDSPRLDNHLYKRVNSYLRSLSLNVQILDENVLRGFKKFGEGALQFFGADNHATGRKRTKNQAYWIAGLLSAGTMLAMALSAMSAMAGKALMTSLLALVLSAFAAIKGHNDDKKSTTYEIITRPIISHGHGHGHKHSEAVADAHLMSGSHTGPSYTYRRSIDHGQPQDYSPLIPIIAATRA